MDESNKEQPKTPWTPYDFKEEEAETKKTRQKGPEIKDNRKPDYERKAELKAMMEKIKEITMEKKFFFSRERGKKEFHPLSVTWHLLGSGSDLQKDYTKLELRYDRSDHIGDIYFDSDEKQIKITMIIFKGTKEEQYQKALELAKVIDEEIGHVTVVNK